MSIAYINTEPRTERDSQYFFSAWRVVEIGFFVALHATCFSLAAAGYLILGRRRRLGALFGRSMANLLEALGPTFIKIGQVLSSRPDLLPGEIINALSRLQDEIAPFDVRKIPAIIQQAFGRPVEEIFESLDLDHVSAASVAHVHRARLKDGRKVAVKIRRPGIIRLVDSDLAILRFIAKTLARIPALRTMPLTQLVDDIGTPIRQQLDFVLEAENNRLFHEQFARVEHIRFPRLVEELCTDSVLTMEYLDDLQKVTSSTFAEAERKVAALAGLRAL
ncbi:MAG TPA: AarF/UbiB family protein, partial [Blastocatellia bacterium]